jgi:cell division protein ZapA
VVGRDSVSVRIAGRDYKVRGDADEAWLQKVAGSVDDAMDRIRKRTGTVDSHDLAVLTALNLARELVGIRESIRSAGIPGADPERLRQLVDLAESSLG